MEQTTPPPCQPSLAGHLFQRIHGLASPQIFHHMCEAMHSGDLSFSQVNALFSLRRFGPQSIKALAQAAHLSHPATSRLVKRLVKSGLVDLKQNPENRRQKEARLTAGGCALLDDLESSTANSYAGLLSGVPAPLMQRICAGLEEIIPFLPGKTVDRQPDPRANSL